MLCCVVYTELFIILCNYSYYLIRSGSRIRFFGVVDSDPTFQDIPDPDLKLGQIIENFKLLHDRTAARFVKHFFLVF
jgi:hypothetical protein